MFATCMAISMLLGFVLPIWVFDDADPVERNRRKREFHFIMTWMMVLDFTTLVTAIITKIY